MRIAYGGFHTESSTYNPVLLTGRDFTVNRGHALATSESFLFLQDFDVEFCPTMHARALPGGPIDRSTYDTFKADFLDRLAACGSLDGLYLALHGAATVDGLDDAEADFVRAARSIVGPDCLISASYDLHGNLSQPIVDELDMFSAYRTAPHIDVEQTMRRSVEMLVESLRTGTCPHVVWCPIPVLLPGEKTATTDEPARSLYARLPDVDDRAGIWDASLLVGYVWADQARATAAAVVTGTQEDAMVAAASELAEAYWAARSDFCFGVETGPLDRCLDRVRHMETQPTILADSGDNPTAGAIGDRADVLVALIESGAQGVIVAGITDEPAVEQAYQAGIGQTIVAQIGASVHPASGPQVRVKAEVLFLSDAEIAGDREAVLKIEGIRLVVSAKRRPYHYIADFERLNLDPRDTAVLVVKSGYLSPELAAIANPPIMALTEGAADQHVERLARQNKAAPSFPFDQTFAWSPQPLISNRARRP